jgi:pentatricopeptide repeat protein
LKLGEEERIQKGTRSTRKPAANLHVPGPARNNRYENDLEALFEKSLHLPAVSEDAPSPLAPSLEPYKHAEILKEKLLGSAPLLESWHYFVEHFGPDVEKPAFTSTPSFLNSIAHTLVRRIIDAKRRDALSDKLPSVTEISKVYLRLGILSGLDWGEMIFILLEQMLRSEQNPPAGIYDHLITDILGAWNVVCRRKGDYHCFPPLGSDLNWSYVPRVSSGDVNQMYRKRGAQVAFGILTPPLKLHHLQAIPMVALATFVILTNSTTLASTYLEHASPFVSLLSQIINTPGIVLGHIYAKDDSSPLIAEFVKSNWVTIKERASQMSEDLPTKQEQPIDDRKPGSDDSHRDSFVQKRLQDALKRGNLRQVNEIWSDVVQWPVKVTNSPQPYSMKRGTFTAELANLFILIYMTLRQPTPAIDVWNHMVRSGLQPTLQSWNAMLSGCKDSRDWKTLEVVWKSMLASGAQPDVVCWTTRISGLIEAYQFDSGIRALDEMGRIWLAAAKMQHPKMKLEQLKLLPGVDGAAKPTIETINGAVGGLLRKHKVEAAHHVLAWGGKFGITPDINTYNALLRPLIRSGHVKQATALLQQMQKAGIQADVATFTTILDETFRSSEHYTPEEQKEIVDSVFFEMKEAGVQPNLHTYATIIYQLLQSSHGNLSVVNAVMERIAQQGLQPSPQIYTMIIQYHFSQRPPNLDAVRAIIERATMVVGGTDHVFWDRVVEGYAEAGETAHALTVVGNLHRANQKLGYLAMRMLLFALAQNEEWDAARTLVRKVMLDSGGPSMAQVHGKLGEVLFWELAAKLHLLDAEQTDDM